jgi:hypothetical protein
MHKLLIGTVLAALVSGSTIASADEFVSAAYAGVVAGKSSYRAPGIDQGDPAFAF